MLSTALDFDADETASSTSRSLPRAPVFRLAFGELLWRVTFFVFLFRELHVIQTFWSFRWAPPSRRIMAILAHTPKQMFRAFLIGAIAAVVCDLVFRLIVRPLMVRWYNPVNLDPASEHPLLFRLATSEAIDFELPARQVQGRHRPPGTLIRTDRTIWFFPFAWDAEPWSLPVDRLAEIHVEPARRRVLGLVKGYPEHLVLIDQDGARSVFVLADPAEFLRRFDGAENATIPPSPTQPEFISVERL